MKKIKFIQTNTYPFGIFEPEQVTGMIHLSAYDIDGQNTFNYSEQRTKNALGQKQYMTLTDLQSGVYVKFDELGKMLFQYFDVYIINYEYSSDGKLTKIEQINENTGLVAQVQYFDYDINGRLLYQEVSDLESENEYFVKHEYNELGLLKSVFWKSKENDIYDEELEKYYYDLNNKIILQECFNRKGIETKRKHYYYNNLGLLKKEFSLKLGLNKKFYLSEIVLYNDIGLVDERTLYDEDFNEAKYSKFKYGEASRFNTDEENMQSVRKIGDSIALNIKSNLLIESGFNFSRPTQKKIKQNYCFSYIYDLQNRLIIEIREYEGNMAHRNEYVHFDNEGNWIECSVFRDEELVSVDKREIVYYENFN